MSYNNLSKVFRYINDEGGEITFLYDNGYLINKPVGIDAVEVNLSQAQGINQVGATVQSKNVQPRAVNISGILVGNQQAEHKDELLGIIRPDIGGRLYADNYYIDCHPTSTPTISPLTEFAKFQFSLLAPYPYWAKDESATVELSTVEGRFRLWDGDDSHTAPDGSLGVWNISGEYSFGEVVERQFFNIYNDGQLPIPFRLSITASGSVVNPKITNVSTGAFLKLNYTVSDGERVVVDITHERTYVTSSLNGDIRGVLSLNSGFNRLLVGDNVVKPEADSGASGMELSISYATEIVGVAV